MRNINLKYKTNNYWRNRTRQDVSPDIAYYLPPELSIMLTRTLLPGGVTEIQASIH